MPEIVPTIGRIVEYTLSDYDAREILKQRGRDTRSNDVEEGQVYPAMIVRVWGDTPSAAVNLKVMLDGEDTYWATSRCVGEGHGNYQWMAYQKGQAAKTEAAEAALASNLTAPKQAG